MENTKTIDEYSRELYLLLKELPQNSKKREIQKISDHLYSLKNEKLEEIYDEEEAEKEAIRSLMPPHKLLAKSVLEEHNNDE